MDKPARNRLNQQPGPPAAAPAPSAKPIPRRVWIGIGIGGAVLLGLALCVALPMGVGLGFKLRDAQVNRDQETPKGFKLTVTPPSPVKAPKDGAAKKDAEKKDG